ncbi:hypothetical protein BDN70DRAFT_878406 [Pholiota conissans]|uniref:Uncharacterized protein n=1 Tax=Pholiota conissans TaxID=109636 RepID=A0A9P6D1K2_9AGAR|nr:hypothetical protein BDN70DRAFT_878406 [Pholiota conissans]
MDRNSFLSAPKPLSYKELTKGALYNAAEPYRRENRHPNVQPSLEHLHLHLHDDSRDSMTELTAGHLYNPTSSTHEVDPPTWPAYGMENVGSSVSPFKSYRHERPPSPKLAKKYIMTYQSRRPSHNTVATGALFNPYVTKRLPAELDTASARLLAESSAVLSRSPSQANHVYQPAPVSLKAKLELSPSVSSNASKSPIDDAGSFMHHQSQHYPPAGSQNPSVRLSTAGNGVPHAPSMRSNASHRDTFTTDRRNIYNQSHSHVADDDDSMYYHPSREQSIHHAFPPPHAFDPTHPHSSRGSMSSLGQVSTRPTPWMQQETVNLAAFESVHPDAIQGHSREGSMHTRPSRDHTIRGGSSLHHEYREGGIDGDANSAHFAPSLHPSHEPTVIRDSVAEDGEFLWGNGPHALSTHVPSTHKGSIRAADSVKNFKTSRTPSATTHVSRFQDQNMIEFLHPGATHSPKQSRAPSRASQIQRHMGGGGGSQAGTPMIHEEESGAQHFDFDHNGGGSVRAPSIMHNHENDVETIVDEGGAPLPIPLRAPSAVSDAASHHSRTPSRMGGGGASRAASALSHAPSQQTLTRRGRASRIGRGGGVSGRGTPISAVPEAESEPPNSASTYRISVVQASDDGRGS